MARQRRRCIEVLRELADRYSPQRALLVKRPPSGADWIHELKLDGYRVGSAVCDDAVRLISRKGNDLTSEFGEIASALRALDVRDALIDGEVVVLDARGRTNFQALQNRAPAREGLTYFAFDLLWLDGQNTSRLPLDHRKQLLRSVLGSLRADNPRSGGYLHANAPVLRFSEHLEADGGEVFERACRLGAEGVVSKRRDASYSPGQRNGSWLKSKCELRQEFVVGGFTEPTSASRGLGSLLIGYREGSRLVWAGKVSRGRGLTESFLRKLRGQLEVLEQEESPFDPKPPGWLGRNAHWLKPRLIVEVSFSEWTEGGQLRHASLEGFRPDKSPDEVVREIPGASPAEPLKRGRVHRDASKVVFPQLNLTKLDLARFYRDICE